MITSVGRRVELVQAFRKAADDLGMSLVLYGADCSETAPALFFCDRQIPTCPISDKRYIPKLLEVCREEKIDALIPTIDTDLLPLARAKALFEAEGTKVFVSTEEKIRLCRDKRLTAEYLLSLGLKTPRPADGWQKYAGGYPCFIKPLDGSSSIDAYKISCEAELKEFSKRIPGSIIQQFIEGTEYTVDVFCDYEGSPLLITPRVRLAIRGGEVLKTEITQDDRIIEECLRIITDFKFCGGAAIQLIRQRETGDDYFIEINPRFGGGAPLSVKAGADSARMLLLGLSGERPEYAPHAARNGEQYSRFDQSVCVCRTESDRVRAILFDLDDTLYPERDYVKSGFQAAAAVLPQIPDVEAKLWRAFLDGKPAFDTVLREEYLFSENLKAKCLLVYRGHAPRLHLDDAVRGTLEELRRKGILLGIITDGRPHAQRTKIQALGLDGLVDAVIVTNELGGEPFRKPCDIAFRILQRRFGCDYGEMIYVGDNPLKDFTAPMALGMRCRRLIMPGGLHEGTAGPEIVPRIASISELLENRRDP